MGRAGSHIRLRWRHGTAGRADLRYEVYRHREPDFIPTSTHRLAAAVAGESFDDFEVQPRTTYTYRIRARNVLGLTSDFTSTQTITPAGGALYLYRNASAAREIRLPFFLRTSLHTGDTYLTTPNSAGSSLQGPPEKGLATYEFQVPRPATYAVWGLAQAPDGSSDSFYWAVDPPARDRFVSRSTPVQDTWAWHPLLQVEWSAGRHTLYVKHREGGAMLRALLLTDDLDFQPAGPEVRPS